MCVCEYDVVAKWWLQCMYMLVKAKAYNAWFAYVVYVCMYITDKEHA